MPKSDWSPTKMVQNKRTKKSTKSKKKPKTVVGDPEAPRQRLETIRTLLPREKDQVECRDKEFRKFLAEQYRMFCPDIKCRYKKVSSAVMSECVDWIQTFKGVNKNTNNAFHIDRRFDLREGRSWVDQRRSKKVTPLFLSWLDTICEAVKEMREANPSLPTNLVVIILEKLLTTSYHPQSSQSNQTLLVCQQALHTREMRNRLKDFNIIVPDSKKQLADFISELRRKVENRRFGIAASDGAGQRSVGPSSMADESDSEFETGSTAPSLVSMSTTESTHNALMMQEAAYAELEKKMADVMEENVQLQAQCVVYQQSIVTYRQQLSRMFAFSAATASGWETSPSQYSSSSSSQSSCSPPLTATNSYPDESYMFPPAVEGMYPDSQKLDRDDYMMTDVPTQDVPMQLTSNEIEEFNKLNFLNWDTFGF